MLNSKLKVILGWNVKPLIIGKYLKVGLWLRYYYSVWEKKKPMHLDFTIQGLS